MDLQAFFNQRQRLEEDKKVKTAQQMGKSWDNSKEQERQKEKKALRTEYLGPLGRGGGGGRATAISEQISNLQETNSKRFRNLESKFPVDQLESCKSLVSEYRVESNSLNALAQRVEDDLDELELKVNQGNAEEAAHVFQLMKAYFEESFPRISKQLQKYLSAIEMEARMSENQQQKLKEEKGNIDVLLKVEKEVEEEKAKNKELETKFTDRMLQLMDKLDQKEKENQELRQTNLKLQDEIERLNQIIKPRKPHIEAFGGSHAYNSSY